MRKKFFYLLVCILVGTACQKSETATSSSNEVTTADLERISALGFNADRVHKTAGGFIVEGDIFLSYEDLQKPEILSVNATSLNEEHYRSPGLVAGLPRILRVNAHPSLPPSIQAAVDSALLRYNSLSLAITFIKVTTPADIHINPVSISPSVFGVSGFPSGGNPYPVIQLNMPVLLPWAHPTITTSITHLIGHAIGFLHTDQMSPSYSCGTGGTGISDGVPGSPGAVIPGTPSGPSPNSWMLTCISNGINRPFTALDITALNVLY
jgi:hypothetical protein